MQLKIKRSQREAGVLSKNVVFCLDARVEFTAEEQASLARHKLWNECIYNSEASKRHYEKSMAQLDGSFVGGLKSFASAAMANLSLNITIGKLASGQHVECRSMDELLGAEEAILTACQNLRSYIDTAASFDGREVLFDFSTGEPQLIAQAVTPSPQLIAPMAVPPAQSMQSPLENTDHGAAPIAVAPMAGAYSANDSGDPLDGLYRPSASEKQRLIAVCVIFVLFIIIAAFSR